jgi:hypothetical protein
MQEQKRRPVAGGTSTNEDVATSGGVDAGNTDAMQLALAEAAAKAAKERETAQAKPDKPRVKKRAACCCC